ncbi:MAG: alpha/beta fold hydrolase, partial [Pseudomonadota bacterium]
MTTYVLIHGGWFGGWCWREVADQLRAKGHLVFTPTLTGLGERSHLASPQITLQTHAQDIANVLIYEDLNDVILLAHSYSGMPVTLVPRLAPGRIQELIYLDAFVPEDGQMLNDLVDGGDMMRRVAETKGFGWLNPPPPLERWHITDPEIK